MLDHPNIISYFDSFEEDGVLMIEIEYADGGFVYTLKFSGYIVLLQNFRLHINDVCLSV